MKSRLDFHPKFVASLASYSKERFLKDLMAGSGAKITKILDASGNEITDQKAPRKNYLDLE